jgi:hypothetical protein
VSVGLCGSIDTHDGNCLPLLPSSGSGSFMSPPPSPSSWTIIALSWVLPPWDVLYVVFPSLACPDRLILLSGFHARTITVWCCAGGPQLEPTRGVPRCTRPIHSPSSLFPSFPSSCRRLHLRRLCSWPPTLLLWVVGVSLYGCLTSSRLPSVLLRRRTTPSSLGLDCALSAAEHCYAVVRPVDVGFHLTSPSDTLKSIYIYE